MEYLLIIYLTEKNTNSIVKKKLPKFDEEKKVWIVKYIQRQVDEHLPRKYL